MSLHVPTLVLMLVVGFGLLTLQLQVAGRGALHRGELPRLAWASGPFCAGFLCFALAPWLPAGLTEPLGHLLLLAGLAGMTAAVDRHLLNRRPPRWHRGLVAGAAVLALAPPLLGASATVQVAAPSAAMAALLLPAVVTSLRRGWRAELSFRVVALLLLLACAALALRTAHALTLTPAEADDADGFLGGALFMLGFMAVLAAGFSFVLASFERVASQMRELASVDGLTGALNHNTALSLLAHTLERGRREGQPVSFVMLDLDHFKRVNDQHGHAVGDQVLKAVASCTRARLRSSDVLGRLGGEEFGLVLPATARSGARHLAEQVRQAVEALELQGDGGRPLRVTLSAGVAEASRTDTPETLMHLADKALYQAKQQGRNRVVVADDWMRNSTLQAVVG